MRARFINGFTLESTVTSTRACSAPGISQGSQWSLTLLSTSSASVTIGWDEPRQLSGPSAGCHISGYRLFMSRDGGVTYAEIDASQVREKANLREH